MTIYTIMTDIEISAIIIESIAIITFIIAGCILIKKFKTETEDFIKYVIKYGKEKKERDTPLL